MSSENLDSLFENVYNNNAETLSILAQMKRSSENATDKIGDEMLKNMRKRKLN